jgi:LacI family transcriptional regulator, repressor for deo operon, udp, cdd, tsx, nupC, and nupG
VAVTLRDVAAHAGVSFRTVSNVVNDYPHVSPAMRARVQASLDALGYRPNLVARSLRAGRSGILLLLVPDIAVPYFGALAHEIVERAREHGCTVMIDETGGVAARERELLEDAVRARWVDGVLISSLGLTAADLDAVDTTVPMVLLGEHTAGSVRDHVGIDDVAAARELVEHLIATGRTRIVGLGGAASDRDATTVLRRTGYLQALEAAGLGPGRHVRTRSYGRASAERAVRPLFEAAEPPDAIFCFSDELAAGTLRTLHDLGVRVPDDVAVAGFDDADGSRYLVPSLTTIRQDRGAIARAAVELLTSRIGGSPLEPQQLLVDHRLVVRESSGPRSG